MTTSGIDNAVEIRLNDREVRYTAGRRTVIAALADSDGPRSASELSRLIGPGVPLSSIYRSLSVLEDAGVLAPHFGEKGLTRYELAEWLNGHHHHLICIDCGAVEDIQIPEPFEAQLGRLVEEMSATVSFRPVNHALEIEGRCAGCA